MTLKFHFSLRFLILIPLLLTFVKYKMEPLKFLVWRIRATVEADHLTL